MLHVNASEVPDEDGFVVVFFVLWLTTLAAALTELAERGAVSAEGTIAWLFAIGIPSAAIASRVRRTKNARATSDGR
jgi:hypothetical protein